MNDEEFKQMINELVSREEQRLQVNSMAFRKRHEEITRLIDKSSKTEEIAVRK